MSNKNCPTGACPLVKNDAEGSKVTGGSGGSNRSGGSVKSGGSGGSHKSYKSRKSGKSGSKYSDKGTKASDGSDAGVSRRSSQKLSGKESMMDDGASVSGSAGGSEAEAPRPKSSHKPVRYPVTFGATGHKDRKDVGLVCKLKEDRLPGHYDCVDYEGASGETF
jgi:hypothetical protein